MPASGINLVDVNVWLALAFEDHRHRASAASWMSQQPNQSCAFCRVTQMALLRHLTNSKIMEEFVQTQQEAWRSYNRMSSDPRVFYSAEPFGLESCFRALTQENVPLNQTWTDAYLAAFSISGGLHLVTFDKGFRRYANLNLTLLTD